MTYDRYLSITGLAATGALLLMPGCGPQPNTVAEEKLSVIAPLAEPLATTSKATLFGGASAVIPTTPCPGSLNPIKVKFTVKPNMLYTLGGFSQHIERKVDTETGGKEKAQAKPPSDIDKTYFPTFLDIGVDAPDGNATWTEITVRLENKNNEKIRFMPVRNSDGVEDPKDSSFAVLAQTKKIDRFCYRQPFDNEKGNDIVRFGVVLDKDETVSINIGLLIEDKKNEGYWIPIYLDPNIKNKG